MHVIEPEGVDGEVLLEVVLLVLGLEVGFGADGLQEQSLVDLLLEVCGDLLDNLLLLDLVGLLEGDEVLADVRLGGLQVQEGLEVVLLGGVRLDEEVDEGVDVLAGLMRDDIAEGFVEGALVKGE